MKLLGYNINDFTHPKIEGLNVCINMRKEIEAWLIHPKRYNLKECSNDSNTRHILGLFQDIQERTSATSMQMVEYFYSLERRIEELELTLEDFMNGSD